MNDRDKLLRKYRKTKSAFDKREAISSEYHASKI